MGKDRKRGASREASGVEEARKVKARFWFGLSQMCHFR